MTQKERLLKYFKQGNKVTRITAITELGIIELSARVKGLESDGFRIERKRIKVRNRFDEIHSVCQYWMDLYDGPQPELGL